MSGYQTQRMVAAQKITNLRGLSAGIDTGWAVQVCNQRVRLPHRRLVSSILVVATTLTDWGDAKPKNI